MDEGIPVQTVDVVTAERKIGEMLAPQFRQVLGIVMRGIMISTPNVPAHIVLNVLCREMGQLAAESLSADLPTVFKLRQGYKAAFNEGVKAAKIAPVPPLQS